MEPKAYELGYLLTPFIPAEVVTETVNKIIHSAITNHGGSITAEIGPVLKTLAYKVVWASGHKSEPLTEAYFGSIRFMMAPEEIANLDLKLKQGTELVRYLIITLSKESDYVPSPRPRRPEITYRPPVTRPEVSTQSKVKLTTEEMDKQIEDLIHVSQ